MNFFDKILFPPVRTGVFGGGGLDQLDRKVEVENADGPAVLIVQVKNILSGCRVQKSFDVLPS